jgi:hypothetical protein
MQVEQEEVTYNYCVMDFWGLSLAVVTASCVHCVPAVLVNMTVTDASENITYSI